MQRALAGAGLEGGAGGGRRAKSDRLRHGLALRISDPLALRIRAKFQPQCPVPALSRVLSNRPKIAQCSQNLARAAVFWHAVRRPNDTPPSEPEATRAGPDGAAMPCASLLHANAAACAAASWKV